MGCCGGNAICKQLPEKRLLRGRQRLIIGDVERKDRRERDFYEETNSCGDSARPRNGTKFHIRSAKLNPGKIASACA
jgi:hypothetical protein